MASAPSEQSSVLQDELTCPVCLDLYREPHLLSCGHNFCKVCLDSLKRQADRGRFRCPECRDSHRCGNSFQKNFKLANIADDYRRRRRRAAAKEPVSCFLSVQQARRAFAVPCDYCPSVAADAPGLSVMADGSAAEGSAADGSAVAAASQDGGVQREAAAESVFAVKTCLKCEVSMCQEHVRPHLELPAFREHLLTEPMNDLWRRKCPDHDEIYRYYCLDDRMCVCNACNIEGGHSGHTIKTLKNSMKDLKGSLDKQLYIIERKYGVAERKLQEQKEKERQNKKFLEDSEQCLTRLGEEMKAKVHRFVTRLRDCARTHFDTNAPAILKNISRISQDQARLQEVRCSIEGLMQENDSFRFIEEYKTTGKRCRKQLRKNMFYPEYVDMETEVLGVMMEEEMRKFLDEELPCPIVSAINSLCNLSDVQEEGEEEQEENEEEVAEDDDDDLDDSSVEEMRSDGEEEEEEEDEEEEEEEEEGDEDEEEEGDEEDDEEEQGV